MGAIEDTLSRFGEQTVNIIRQNLNTTGTNASGDTSKSLKSTMLQPNHLQVTGKDFLYVVETGRKPGKAPPISPIMKWIDSGKASFTGSKLSFAFAISKSIAKSGSSLFRAGGRTDIITPAISDKRIDQLTSEIATISLDLLVKNIEDGS